MDIFIYNSAYCHDPPGPKSVGCMAPSTGQVANILDLLALTSGEGNKEGQDDSPVGIRVIIKGECTHLLTRQGTKVSEARA